MECKPECCDPSGEGCQFPGVDSLPGTSEESESLGVCPALAESLPEPKAAVLSISAILYP